MDCLMGPIFDLDAFPWSFSRASISPALLHEGREENLCTRSLDQIQQREDVYWLSSRCL